MMACCVIAAFLLAQIVAMVRRWGIFWGVVRPVDGEDATTALSVTLAWLRRPQVKRAVFALGAVELALFSGWVYTAHGTHLYQLGDQTLGSIRGEHIVYAGACGPDGKDHAVRIVIADAATAASHS